MSKAMVRLVSPTSKFEPEARPSAQQFGARK
jgi:hypothetical protein